MSKISIRRGTPDDFNRLAQIYFDAIHLGAARWYDAAQRRAWAPAPPDPAAWADRLSAATVVVATAGSEPVGFMTLGTTGYVDLAFVAPAWSGRGIGRRLGVEIEYLASAQGMSRLYTQASLGAQPMFEACGWHVVRDQVVERAGVRLANCLMEKPL